MNKLFIIISSIACILPISAMEMPEQPGKPMPKQVAKLVKQKKDKDQEHPKIVVPASVINNFMAMGRLEDQVNAIIDTAQTWYEGEIRIVALLAQIHPHISNEDIRDISIDASRRLREKIDGQMSQPVYPKKR